MPLKTLILCAALASVAVAQQPPVFSASFQNNPATLGSTVNMELTAVTQIGLSNGCGLNAVRFGSPTGPVVFQPFICPLIFITVGPGQPWTVSWTAQGSGGRPLMPGTYFIEVGGTDPNGRTVTAHFPIRVDDPGIAVPPSSNGPVLSATIGGVGPGNPTAATGDTIDLAISAPWEPSAPFFLAASATTNTGIPLGGGQHVALDQDLIFGLSFPIADPSLFSGFVGQLDVAGMSASSSVNVPPGVLPVGFPLAFQGVVIGNQGSQLTNPVCVRTL